MSSCNIDLKEILRRRIVYVTEEFELFSRGDFDDEPDSITYEEYKAQFDGELRAYRDMYDEVCRDISEEEFIDIFFERMLEYERISRGRDTSGNIIDIRTGMLKSELERLEFGGYFYAVKEILNLFLPVKTDEDFE